MLQLQPTSASLCRVSPETFDKLIEKYSDNGYINMYAEELIIDLTHIVYDQDIREEFLHLTGLKEDQLEDDGYITFYF